MQDGRPSLTLLRHRPASWCAIFRTGFFLRTPLCLFGHRSSDHAAFQPGFHDSNCCSDSANNLLRVDVNSGIVRRIEGTFAQMTDIAFSPTGELYGVTPSYLYEMEFEIGWDTHRQHALR